MTSAREKELYFQARDRALERMTQGSNYIDDSCRGFSSGLNLKFTREEDEILPENNFSFAFICGVLSRLEATKGKSYQASWMRHGTSSVFHHIQRKFDIVDANMNGNKMGESLPTNLADLAVYCMKELTRQAQLNPEEVKNWLEEVRKLS